jgi:hypothetical protein
MDTEIEKLTRTNAALEAWVRDLLEENRLLRERVENQASAGPAQALAPAGETRAFPR